MPKTLFVGLAAAVIAAATTETATAQVPPNLVNAPAVRIDPYKNYKFRVIWDGRIIIGVTRVSGLIRDTEGTAYTSGGGGPTMSLPGRTKYEPITLERGLTHDPAFETWADAVYTPGGPAAQPQAIRKDVEIQMLDESGHQLLFVFKFLHCWPTSYTAMSGLEAGAAAAPVQRLTLLCETWDRDRAAGTGP